MTEVNEDMKVSLKNENIDIMKPLQSYEKLNEILLHFKELYKDQVEYINIYQTGSVFHIEYTKRNEYTKHIT